MRLMKRIVTAVVACALLFTVTVPVFAANGVYSSATADQWMPQKYTGFTYSHDPMKDERAAKDIIVNENAIYGYSPNPESDRIGEFASYDWSDPSVVWKARQNRLEYFEQDTKLYNTIAAYIAQGKSMEETAREISRLRNEIRLESYKDDPAGLAKLKASNLKSYGNEEGPTADSLYKKYGSWDKVLEKAFSTNHGMDACLGLYDDNYSKYVILGEMPSDN